MAIFQVQAVTVNKPAIGRGVDVKMKVPPRKTCMQYNNRQHSKNSGRTVNGPNLFCAV
jgi:hypothetical protein